MVLHLQVRCHLLLMSGASDLGGSDLQLLEISLHLLTLTTNYVWEEAGKT